MFWHWLLVWLQAFLDWLLQRERILTAGGIRITVGRG